MWQLEHKEGWALKKWCFWIVVLEKTLDILLDCKEIKLVNPKWNQPWILTGRTVAAAPILWPPEAKSKLIGKDPDGGHDWRQEGKRVTEDEMVRQHHQLNEHEFEQTPEDSGGQGSLACYSPWGGKESDTILQQNNNNKFTHTHRYIMCTFQGTALIRAYYVPTMALDHLCYTSRVIDGVSEA